MQASGGLGAPKLGWQQPKQVYRNAFGRNYPLSLLTKTRTTTVIYNYIPQLYVSGKFQGYRNPTYTRKLFLPVSLTLTQLRIDRLLKLRRVLEVRKKLKQRDKLWVKRKNRIVAYDNRGLWSQASLQKNYYTVNQTYIKPLLPSELSSPTHIS